MITETEPVKRSRARLTRQGQITVPKAVRDALDMKPGDELEFVPRGEELVVEVRHRRSVLDFAGIASSAAPRVPGSAAELDELVQQGMADLALARATAPSRRTRRPR
jgi:AbrB family looped-hinge helix DNA binding protein